MGDEVHNVGKLEQRITRLEDGQQALIAGMSRIETIAEQLASNQKGVFNRMNRPWQWGVIVSVFIGLFTISGAFGTVLTLSLNPIKDSVEHIESSILSESRNNFDLHLMLNERMNQAEMDIAVNKESQRWIEKVESRYFLNINEKSKSHVIERTD